MIRYNTIQYKEEVEEEAEEEDDKIGGAFLGL
jgi:hypothetical protein